MGTNVVTPGFGGNVDNIAGATPGVGLSQLAFGEWRARSIFGGAYGAIIQSIHVTPRDPTSAGPKYPAAGFFTMFAYFSNVAMDPAQMYFSSAADIQKVILGNDPIFQFTRSNQQPTDLTFPPHGIFVKPNTFAHIVCVTALTAANTQISSFYDLSVTGRYLDGDGSKWKLR